jgi:hypothetical protein
MFRNPFEEQAQYHKGEMQKWSKTSKIVGMIFIILLFLLFFSCNNLNKEDLKVQDSYEVGGVTGHNYRTLIIDSCEYLQSTYDQGTLTHKGNCRNRIHTLTFVNIE